LGRWDLTNKNICIQLCVCTRNILYVRDYVMKHLPMDESFENPSNSIILTSLYSQKGTPHLSITTHWGKLRLWGNITLTLLSPDFVSVTVVHVREEKESVLTPHVLGKHLHCRNPAFIPLHNKWPAIVKHNTIHNRMEYNGFLGFRVHDDFSMGLRE